MNIGQIIKPKSVVFAVFFWKLMKILFENYFLFFIYFGIFNIERV